MFDLVKGNVRGATTHGARPFPLPTTTLSEVETREAADRSRHTLSPPNKPRDRQGSGRRVTRFGREVTWPLLALGGSWPGVALSWLTWEESGGELSRPRAVC
ncbi:hypothetical protein E2C01_044703 [Portunus trituberculatus]|uniref:Uncharacterized protein n=1 Tax=Portunus trituberculatus TaxID=210409 RepID=A0A5B7G023_PORTR|nr:hypothetical protein [Portunus trituberculatus]